MHDTSSRCNFAAVTTCGSFSFPEATKIFVPTSVAWETAILSGLEGEAEQAATPPDKAENTLAFFHDNVNAPIASWKARDLFYDLSSIRILLQSLFQHWGNSHEMEKVVGPRKVDTLKNSE